MKPNGMTNVFRFVVGGALAWYLLGTSTLLAQDLIRFRPKGESIEIEKECEIQAETPQGLVRVKLKSDKDPIEVEPSRIVHLLARVPGKGTSQMREPLYRAQQAERETNEMDRGTQMRLAIQAAEDCLAKVEGTIAARGWSYLVASLKARLGEAEPQYIEEALQVLGKNREVLASGWTEVPAFLLWNQLLQVKGDNDGAQKILAQLGNRAGLAPSSRDEVLALRARLLLRLGKNEEAKAELTKIQNPQTKAILDLARTLGKAPVESAKWPALRTAIAQSPDPGTQALGCNLLGESLLAAGKKDEALWEFLKVETLFSQDRGEEARALFHLATLFDAVRNDPGRASTYRDKLKRPYFGGTPYPAMLR